MIRQKGQAAFLFHEGFQLPSGFGDGGFTTPELNEELTPQGSGEGRTFIALLAPYDHNNLFAKSGDFRFEGLRLPDLPRYLATTTPTEYWPYEIRDLRARLYSGLDQLDDAQRALIAAIYENPGSQDGWCVFADWLAERGLPGPHIQIFNRVLPIIDEYRIDYEDHDLYPRTPADIDLAVAAKNAEEFATRSDDGTHEPAKSYINVTEHMAQICLHEMRESKWGELYNVDMYQHWISFDDCWASANEDLANGILRFACGWTALGGAL